ncbi:uracil phosphoribosyltransferase [Luteolibacter sp. AS25]|uniref:uracil phosphoribosyltransferase n=1 Tax=Luteolibacter sp. AS25 TaxID=3135776 RepID=UPI00398A7B15
MLHSIEHPLISSELTRLRNPDTSSRDFRAGVRRIAALMVPQVTASLQTCVTECNTPLEITSGEKLVRPVILVPILRAGLGFLDGFLDLMPDSGIAHIGIARNEETLAPETYVLKHPEKIDEAELIVLDPMLATGGSAIHAISRLLEGGAKRIRFVCMLAAPEGIAALRTAHPEVDIYAAAIDRCLDAKGFILPGLGDAGDRLFGTI